MRYFGAVVGRYGNRIANGAFTLDGKKYTLVKNNGPNHQPGGTKGFDKVLWNEATKNAPEGASAIFTYTSPDGEGGNAHWKFNA